MEQSTLKAMFLCYTAAGALAYKHALYVHGLYSFWSYNTHLPDKPSKTAFEFNRSLTKTPTIQQHIQQSTPHHEAKMCIAWGYKCPGLGGGRDWPDDCLAKNFVEEQREYCHKDTNIAMKTIAAASIRPTPQSLPSSAD